MTLKTTVTCTYLGDLYKCNLFNAVYSNMDTTVDCMNMVHLVKRSNINALLPCEMEKLNRPILSLYTKIGQCVINNYMQSNLIHAYVYMHIQNQDNYSRACGTSWVHFIAIDANSQERNNALVHCT